jgi:YVTN family beta-propeller protein
LVYNARADVVYGRTNTGNRFFAIDCAGDTLVASLALTCPRYMVHSLIENKVYCTYGMDWDSVLVVSGVTHQPVRRLHLTDANTPVVDSIGNRLYVSCTESNTVAVIDCATDSVIATIPVGVAPLKLHVNPLRRKLYVQNYDENTVSIVDMTTNQVVKTVSTGGYPLSGWYDSECDKYYCGTLASEAVVFSGVTDTVLYRIPLGGSVDVVGGGWSGWWRSVSTTPAASSSPTGRRVS